MSYEGGRFLQVLSVMLVGGLIGILTALYSVQLVYNTETQSFRQWRAEPRPAAVDANRWLRTASALSGTWLPSGANVTEWTALRDRHGKRLTGRCTYYLLAQQVPDSFWTMAVYDNDHNLPPARGRPQFVVSSDLIPDTRNQIQVQAGGPDQGGAWLPAPDGKFSLTLRVYGPSTHFDTRADSPPQFTIDRGACS